MTTSTDDGLIFIQDLEKNNKKIQKKNRKQTDISLYSFGNKDPDKLDDSIKKKEKESSKLMM